MKKRSLIFYIACFFALFLVFLALFAPKIAPYNPQYVEIANKLARPSKDHLLGTDHMGRDVLSRLIFGARLSLSIAGMVTLLNLAIGLPIGLVVGWLSGPLEKFFTWFSNLVMAFPPFLLSMAFAGIMGQGVWNIIIAVSMVGWVTYARMARNMVFVVKDRDYVVSAKTMGANLFYLLRVHIFPFVFKPILILSLTNLGEIVLMISGFSFLGIGVQPNISEWGMMLNDARPYFRSIPGLAIYPGLAILFTVVTLNLLGEEFGKKEKRQLWGQ